MKNKLSVIFFSLGAVAALHAAPKLRLTQTALGPVLVAQGSNGPTQTVNAFNIGNGSLSLKATASDPWLVPTIGSTACLSGPGCVPVQIALQTAGLAKGTYTGFVTLTDPNAIDAPQTISVTVAVGGNVPDQLTFYVPPNGTASSDFATTRSAILNRSTQSGGDWLSLAVNGSGSFVFAVPYTVQVNAAGLNTGDYNGAIAVTGSSIATENKSVPVTLHVTTQPIAQPTSSNVQFQITQGAAKQIFYVVLNNTGQGTLAVSGATVATASGGTWLTAATTGNVITLTADPAGLSPGTYQGTLTIASNAANGTTTVPVRLTIVAAGPPTITYGGAVNVFTNSAEDGVSQGDVLAIYGNQFTTADAQAAAALPLTTTLNGVQVLLNGNPIPVQYVSATQINVQIPYDAPLGDATLNVVANGQKSNAVSLQIQPTAPVLLPYQGGPYVIAQTASGGFEGYSPSAPAHAGDTLVLYAVGLGATSPAVPAGTASPSSPLANVATPPMICFGAPNPINPTALCTAPSFAGLTPTFFGLYQLNFVVPDNAPKGDSVAIFVQVGQGISNVLHIAIQ